LKLLIAVDKSRFPYIEQFSEELKKKGIECLVIDDLDIYDDSKFDKRFLRWTKTPKKFSKIISDFKPDLAFTERVSHFSSLIIKKNIPLVIFLRGDYWKELKSERSVKNNFKNKRLEDFVKENIAEKCFKKSALILPICKYLQKIVNERYPGKTTPVLYQGIKDSDWFYEKGMKLKHPCVGLIQDANIWEKTKELSLLPNILDGLPNVNFYWAGDGKYSSKILQLLEGYENFHWLGNLAYPEEVRRFLSEIDIYGLLTGIDMSPHTLLEAGLMKKPVLATNVGGVSESCINNKTCFLIEKGDPQGWIDKISVLLEDKEKMLEMGMNGREFVKENFSWEKIAEDFIKHLKLSAGII
tara:strand:+ start:50 stop:1114 length:1065 start_codon:yes stop_codon:yes gene_type:complete